MLFPTKPILDSFNEPDASIAPGWNSINNAAFDPVGVGVGVAGQCAQSLNYPTPDAWSYWTATNFSPDQEAYASLASYGQNPFSLPWCVGIGCRVTSPGTANHSGYYLMIGQNSDFNLVRVDAGAFTVLVGPSEFQSGMGSNDGTIIGIQAVGDRLAAWLGPHGGLPGHEVLTYDISGDATKYRGIGRVALAILDSSQIQNFGGGTITTQPGSPLLLPHSVSGSLR